MNPDRLLQHFERISEAPDSIPRLRRFILDLAVRGKLVEQDPNDEPAAELLKRIQAKKVGVKKETKAKMQQSLPINERDEPYLVPKNWVWALLGEIGDWGSGSTPPRGNAEYYGDGMTWLKSGELGDNLALVGSEECVTSLALEKCSFRLNQPGDVLIAMYGATIGKLAILAEKAVTNQAVCGCTPATGVFNKYLFLFLLSRRGDFHGQSEGGAQPNISKVKIISSPFALPPLAEQHRIVAKVDELMALCDQLEAAKTGREQSRDRLVAASLQRLNQPADDEAAFREHARFTFSHLPRLTTRPEHIKQLRQTILNLAVRGKLVPQDPNDEPAEELLKRIQVEKAHLVKVGDIRIEKPQPPLSESERVFGPPTGWTWCRLGALVLDSDSGWSPRTENYARKGDAWGVLKVSAVSWDHFDPTANKQVLPGTEPRFQAQVHKGDFLISRANTAELIARAVLVLDEPIKLMMSDKIVRLRLASTCNHRFAWLINNYADFARSYYAANATGVSPSMKNVSRSVILDLPVPLPPLAEQHRIVAKVGELMALCDQLEAQLTTNEAYSRRLLEAVLHEAIAPAMEAAA